MATSAGGSNQLMAEINDQFLVCKICYDVYKNPKTLSCLHTFCADCLERHQDAELERSYRYLLYSRAVSCPICRKKTEIPTGGIRRLPDNFLVSNLSDVVNRRKPTHKVPQCEICKSQAGPSSAAVSKCLDCCKLLCRNCVELHKKTKVTQSHGLFDIEVEKDIICKFHPDEVVRFYCEPCEVCVCVLCTFQEHKGHEVSSFTEGIEKYHHSLDSLLVTCRERISQLKDELFIISKCENDIKHTEQQITDMAIESISAIRKKEHEMVTNLYLTYGDDTLEFMKDKELLQESVDSLQSTCNLTDIILKDKSIELLLLKKEIQEKLNLLLQRKWQHPPPSALQKVQFIPGRPSFGFLQIDGQPPEKPDCPAEMTYRAKAGIMSVNTQTDIPFKCDIATTMDKRSKSQHSEGITQTDSVVSKEAGTAPVDNEKPTSKNQFTSAAPTVRDRQTMTVGTPTMKRKVQTENVTLTHHEIGTSTRVSLSSLKESSCSRSFDTSERSTMTKIRKLNDQNTCTSGLIATQEHDTETDRVTLVTCGTETSPVASYNKGTLTTQVELCDKLTSTAKVVLQTRDTNTPTICHSDVGVHAKMYGQDASVATRTVVTVHTATGDQSVSTCDQAVLTKLTDPTVPTADKQTSYDIFGISKSCMTDVSPDVYPQNKLNTLDDKSVGTDTPHIMSVQTNTDISDVPVNPYKSKYEKDDTEKENVETLNEICQTMISMIDVVMWPSLMPVDQGTNTESVVKVGRDVEVNTTSLTLSHVGVGDCSYSTLERSSSTTDIPVERVNKPVLKEQWSITDQLSTVEAGMCTEPLTLTDFYSFRRDFVDTETNTDDVVVSQPKKLNSTATNTIAVDKIDAASSAIVDQHDAVSETRRFSFVACSTNTDQPKTMDSQTTMNSNAKVQDMHVNTKTTTLSTTGSETTPIYRKDATVATDHVDTFAQSTETDQIALTDQATETTIATQEYGMVTSVPTQDAGVRTDDPSIRHQETSMDPPLHSDIAVGTVPVLSNTKSTHTDPKETKDVSSFTYVANVDKATYMPQPVTVTASTSTLQPLFFNKTVATDQVELLEKGSNTAVKRTNNRETSMQSYTTTHDAGMGTQFVEMIDGQNDPMQLVVEAKSTNTRQVEMRDTQTGTKETITLTTGTTTNHRVACDDVSTETMSTMTKDQDCATEPLAQHDKGILTKPECRNFGVLKKPHTISRGIGTLKVKLCNSATSPDEISSVEKSTLTSSTETCEKYVDAKPVELVHQSSSTPQVFLEERATETTSANIVDRGCSPTPSSYTDRACSPIIFPRCERQTSPIAREMTNQAIDVKPTSASKHTSTVQIALSTTSTDMPPVESFERASSPCFISKEFETVHRSTSMPEIMMKDEQLDVKPNVTDKCISTTAALVTDRASTPIPQDSRDQCINAVVTMSSTETSMPHVLTKEQATLSRPRTVQTGTEMPHINVIDKETCTPYIHTLHKNVSTENMDMVDKQTNTSDVTAIYRDLVAPSRRLMVTRGTTMGCAEMVSRETSPPSQAKLTERASSPVKVVMVDKGVLAKKGEILEPVDTFQSAGGKNKPSKPMSKLGNAMLESITEDGESSQDEEPPAKRLPRIRAKPHLPPLPRLSVSGVTHKERFWPATPRMGKNAVSGFSVEGRSTTGCITYRVETGTNTPGISSKTKATSTPVVGMTDKAVSTESMPVETKMAECISKLKTVRQRLEVKQQEGVYVQAPGNDTSKLSITTSTESDSERPKVSVTLRSKSVEGKLDAISKSDLQSVVSLTAPTVKTSSSSDRNSSSDESDGPRGKGSLARKRRLNINQLLRSASLPERDNPPSPLLLPKPKIQTVHTQVIPKLNIDEIKSNNNSNSKEKKKASGAAALPRSSSPPKVPPRKFLADANRSKSRESSPREALPEPPARTSSLRHTAIWNRLSPSRKKEGSPAKKDARSSPSKK